VVFVSKIENFPTLSIFFNKLGWLLNFFVDSSEKTTTHLMLNSLKSFNKFFSAYYHNSLQFTAGKKHHTRLPKVEDVCNESSLFATC
jgi:hypothetical protein